MKFKVGDKVYVVDDSSSHGLFIGDVTEIKDIDESASMYYDGEWWFYEKDLEYVNKPDIEVFSPETTVIIEMFMNIHSGKLSDYSRIEWPTAVNMAKVYTQKMIETLESDYAVLELEKHKRILEELNR